MIDQGLCIVGLGLMGGSLARALQGKARQVVGVDVHAATRQAALRDGVVHMATDNLQAGLETAGAVILATPVGTILEILAALPALVSNGCMVLDLGSTKQVIVEAMAALPPSFAAIGGHPMCGKETAGYQAADANLFAGESFILSRSARTTAAVESFALSLVDALGAKPLFLEAATHDQLVAMSSHLPYTIAAVLMRCAAGVGDPRLWSVSASGFRDTARLAGSDPRMMLEILVTNRAAVREHLATYQASLAHFARLLEEGDETSLAAWLGEAQRQHMAYQQQKQFGGGDRRKS